MSHASSDAVMDPIRALPDSLQLRFGVQFRFPSSPPPPLESLIPACYVRIQVASPPPPRIGGNPWSSGLRVDDGTRRKFAPEDLTWQESGVSPETGVKQLDRPDPETLVVDTWLPVAAVSPAEAITRTFTLIDRDTQQKSANHFITVPYPTPKIGGKPLLGLAGVCYYYEGFLQFTRVLEPSDTYIAVSFARFGALPGSSSADYIVAVEHPRGPNTGVAASPPPPLPFTPNRW